MSDEQREFATRTPIGIQSAREKGFPDEPRVTEEEELLYAEAAGLVRLLGQAATATQRAYSIACKLRSEFPDAEELPTRPFGNEAEVAALDKAVEETWDAHQKARFSYRNTAARATDRFRQESDSMEIRGSGSVVATTIGSTARE